MTWMLTRHGGWDGGDEGIADSARGSLCGLRLPRWIGCANDQRMLRLDAPHKARAAIDTAAMACTARLRIGCGTETALALRDMLAAWFRALACMWLVLTRMILLLSQP